MIDLTDYKDVDGIVTIVCNDGDILKGELLSVDDEEESGLGEMGVTIYRNGRYIGIGQSEIEKIITD